jgi:hypothetical protein
VEAEDRWVVPLDGGTVAQCRVGYALTLVIDGARGSFEVRIEQPFELGGVDGGPTSLSWEGDPAALGPALAVAHAEVDAASAFKDRRLALCFGDGGWLRAAAGEEFDAWTRVGPGGLRLVRCRAVSWRCGRLTARPPASGRR